MRLSFSRWRLLSRITFGVFATGCDFEDRPSVDFNGTDLVLHFTALETFTRFTQRAFRQPASALIDFEVDVTPQRVVGTITMNNTPRVELVRDGSVEPDLDPSALIIRI